MLGGALFQGLPKSFEAGRYHSLFAQPTAIPEEFLVTAKSEDGIVMAVEHACLPIATYRERRWPVLGYGARDDCHL